MGCFENDINTEDIEGFKEWLGDRVINHCNPGVANEIMRYKCNDRIAVIYAIPKGTKILNSADDLAKEDIQTYLAEKASKDHEYDTNELFFMKIVANLKPIKAPPARSIFNIQSKNYTCSQCGSNEVREPKIVKNNNIYGHKLSCSIILARTVLLSYDKEWW